MKIKGMNYDIGIQFAFGVPESCNNRFNPEQMKTDFAIIKNDLGCNAIRLSGTNVDEMVTGTELVLQAGLDCWVSPHYIDAPIEVVEKETQECAARVEALRQKYPDNEVVFMYGCEMHHFAPFIPGANFAERIQKLGDPKIIAEGTRKLNEYFARTIPEIRRVFHGRITYCTVWFEPIDWTLFDIISLDHYKDMYNNKNNKYIEDLKPFTQLGKPFAVTEIGYCCFEGCSQHGAAGYMQLYPVGNGMLNTVMNRAEKEQADALVDALNDIDAAGCDGAFAFTFVYGNMPHVEDDPIRDMDMAGFSVVKTFADGRKGKVFPGTSWDPKEAFYALQDFNKSH